MQEITNSRGEKFTLELTAGRKIKKIQARLGVDFLEPEAEAEGINEILSSTRKMMDLIICMMPEDPANEDDFWELFTAKELSSAITKARAEVAFFIQTVDPQTTILKRMATAAKIEEVNRARLIALLESDELEEMTSEEMERAIQTGLTELRSTIRSESSRISSPESLAQTSTT